MGKFDGMLLVSDFDNTLVYTEHILGGQKAAPVMSERNRQALEYFMAEGGRFAVATGRSLAAYRKASTNVPSNAPSVVNNGGLLYDFQRDEEVLAMYLPEDSWQDAAHLAEKFPDLTIETCDRKERVQVLRPIAWNDNHAQLSGKPYEVIDHIGPEVFSDVLFKVLLVGDPAMLLRLQGYVQELGWGERYEFIFSADHLLEMTPKGANKGAMVGQLKKLCGCEKLFCAGDHLNDLPMLSVADRAFCPANSKPEVLASGATVVCHCAEGAMADIVAILEQEG